LEFAWNAYGKAKSEALSGVVALAQPTLEAANPPRINGVAQQGQTLTALPGSWTSEPSSYHFQWLRCDGAGNNCAAIEGASAETKPESPSTSYVPQPQDVEHELRVEVIAKNGSGSSAPAISAATEPILIAAPSNRQAPTITGSAIKGEKLSVNQGTWEPEPTERLYQWLRCEGSNCTAIEGAKASTYELTNADVGFTIEVKETGKNAGGWSSATSAPTGVVQAVPPPSVSGVEPVSGSTLGHTSVTITGAHLSKASAVKFGSVGALKYEVLSETSIKAESPEGTGTVDVTVTTPGGTSPTGAGDRFEYVPPPAVTKIEPTSGPTGGGTLVTITGTNLAKASAVHFGLASGTVESDTETSITVRSPQEPIPGTVDVTVSTPYGTSATGPADQFTYVAPPSISKLEPNAGPNEGKTLVTISGAGFTGASAVKFAAASALKYEVLSDSSIRAESPAGSGTVEVSVTTPYGSSSAVAADQYTYYPAPTVTKLKPDAGPTAGGTTVEVTGTNFTGASAVKFGSSNAVSFKVLSATAISAVSPAHEAGAADVTVTTPGGTSALVTADRFKYQPAITSVSPTGGSILGGTSVTIHGEGFSTTAGATKFKFGTTLAPTVTCASSTECTAISPPHEAGTIDIRATVAAQTSPKATADQYTYS
jgi:hypothetical protein